ncbi:MAG: M23 family metallopeptidase [Proteobacteria bacterium]|nr:M23 family metallopeptidase [Pseudomonadota bacterium]
MKRALRFPLRWAGRNRTLLTAVALSAALGACDNVIYGAREGTMEYPGSGAAANAVPVYTVKSKDTVDSIASRYGVSSQTIIERNNLKAPYRLTPGTSLQVPGARVVMPSSGDTSVASAETRPSAPGGARGAVQKQTLAPPPGTQGETTREPPNPARPAAGEPTPLSPAAAEVPAGPPPRFAWPAHGKILATYGTGAGGQKNDGIDIAVEKGAPIKAADGGTVLYAGSDVAQLGNLLLIRHSGGYITAYGNNEQLLVKKDETVKKGQVIAKGGSTANVASPRLHFEIRRGGSKTADPISMLPPQ